MNANIILAVVYYVVLLVWFWIMWKEKNPKPNELFAITVPDKVMENEEIQKVREHYTKALMLCALLSVCLPVSLFFAAWVTVQILLWMICFILLVCLSFFPYVRANKKIRELKEENHYMNDAGNLTEIDHQWKYGIFYHNPQDQRLLAEKKVGVGTCINHARPMGKFLTGLAGAAIAAMFVLGIYLIKIQSTPLTLSFEDGTLEAGQIRTNYSMDVDMMQMALLLDELPSSKRIIGTGMDNVMRGVYNVDGIGNCKVNLKPQNQTFILIYGEDGCYIFSADKDEETKAIFKELKEEL